MAVSSWTDDSRRICGPLLDRADLRPDRKSAAHIEVSPRSRPAASRAKKLAGGWLGEPSPCLGYKTGAIRKRVEAARARQRQRFEGTRLLTNAYAFACAKVGPGEVRELCRVDDAGASLLRAAMKQLHMSARAYADSKGIRTHSEAGADDCGPFDTSGQAWRAATRFRRHTWPRRSSIDQEGNREEVAEM